MRSSSFGFISFDEGIGATTRVDDSDAFTNWIVQGKSRYQCEMVPSLGDQFTRTVSGRDCADSSGTRTRNRVPEGSTLYELRYGAAIRMPATRKSDFGLSGSNVPWGRMDTDIRVPSG